jgi:hypothetical protein
MKSLKSISTALRDTAAARSTSKGSGSGSGSGGGKRVRWAADVRDPASSGGLGAAVLVLDAALENVSTLTHSLTHSLICPSPCLGIFVSRSLCPCYCRQPSRHLPVLTHCMFGCFDII